MLNERFIQAENLGVVVVDLYVQMIVCGVLSSPFLGSIYEGNSDDTKLIIAIIALISCTVWRSSWGVRLEIYAHKLSTYFLHPENYVDLAHIILVSFTIHVFLEIYGGDVSFGDGHRGILVSTTAIAWLKLLFVLGYLSYSISVFINAVVHIVWDLVPFVVTTFLFIVSFSQMYLIAGAGSQECDPDFKSNDKWIWCVCVLTFLFQHADV